ncbi:MAG: hypothetical protein ACK58N_17295 [Synechocystis sp.]|jgi:hypothetical protein
MFISTQSPRSSDLSLQQKCPAELTSLDLEWLLTKNNYRNVDIVDLETREQILQSVVMRMGKVCYLRRLSVNKIRATSRS